MIVNKKHMLNIVLLLGSIIISLAVAEVITRAYMKDRLNSWDERNVMYRYDSTLGWFPIKNLEVNIQGDHYENNSKGFRDIEHTPDNRPGVLVLGDSFTWGYGVDQKNRYTDLLRRKLPLVSIFNLGVSGYGTDQEYLLLLREFDFYRPRIVFLEFTTSNDELDNSTNVNYGTYPKPYFKVNGENLELGGVPVPKSINYFISGRSVLSNSYLVRLAVFIYYEYANPRKVFDNPTRVIIKNMDRFVKSKGAILLVGFQQSHPELESYLEYEGIPYVDLSNPFTFEDEGCHWTTVGHSFVSEKILHFFKTGNYLN